VRDLKQPLGGRDGLLAPRMVSGASSLRCIGPLRLYISTEHYN
jgi:hypothetical protein